MKAGAEDSCLLCGLAVGKRWGKRAATPEFCCTGCEKVYEILQSVPAEQANQIMDNARRLGLIPGEATQAAAPPAPEPVPAEAQRSERFAIEGLACPSCAWLVSILLARAPGVISAQADFMSDSVAVNYDMRRAAPDEFQRLLAQAGYRLRPLGGAGDPEENRHRAQLTRFIFSLFLAANIMMLSAVHWASYLEWIPSMDLAVIAGIQLAMILPLAWLGVRPLAQRAIRMLKMGRASMDLLFVMGFSAAFSLSMAAFVIESSQFYFDACAAFVAISLLGRLVEGQLRVRAIGELRALLDLSATKAAVLGPDDTVDYRPLTDIGPGTQVRVEPGQTVPLDCVCESEGSSVGEAMLTGESAPVRKNKGDPIWAGSTVLGEPLRAKVSRPFQHSRLQAITDAMTQALRRNEMRLRSADRLAAWFVPAVVLCAFGTFAIRAWWAPGSGPGSAQAWLPAISVLLVACPCGFGIALASALAVAISALLKKGILVKDGSALEWLDQTDRLVLDKTGTLTTGLWQAQKLIWFDREDRALLAAVAGAEQQSDHPVAHCLVSFLAQDLNLETSVPGELELRPGQGLLAQFGDRTLSVGNSALFAMDRDPVEVDNHTTVIYFGWQAKAQGCFLLTDQLRTGSKEMVGFFQRRAIACAILSGDRPAVVQAVGADLDIAEARGGLSPEQKQQAVREWVEAGHLVTFAGDGANDGPAMAEAQVSIALRHGTDLSLAAATIVPLKGDLASLPRLFSVAAKVRRAIRRNYAWAFAYNLLFLPLAAVGLLHPIFAAGLMFLSSTTVLLHSLRIRTWIDQQWQSADSGI